MNSNKGNISAVSEEEFGKRIDRCGADTIIKGSGGLLIGSILSLLVFKGRTWPILTGAGFGVGVAYKTCEKDLNRNVS